MLSPSLLQMSRWRSTYLMFACGPTGAQFAKNGAKSTTIDPIVSTSLDRAAPQMTALAHLGSDFRLHVVLRHGRGHVGIWVEEDRVVRTRIASKLWRKAPGCAPMATKSLLQRL